MNKLRVFIVDDHPVVLEGLNALVGSQPDMEVVGNAANGAEAVRIAARLGPDLIVMDIGMPDTNGILATRQLRRALPDVKILILTIHEDRAYLREVIEAGAQGYVVKRTASSDLLNAVRTVAAGGLYVDGLVARAGSGTTGGAATLKEAVTGPALSDREVAVVRLIAEGYSNKEVGAKLAISGKTVETYKRRVMEKLGIETRPEIVRYAVTRGWLTTQ